MKKLLLLILSIFISFGLLGCEKEVVEEEEVILDIPDEVFVNLQDLPYFEHISLLNPVVTISVRGMGDIVLQLFPDVAPNTVNNFIANIQSGGYTDNSFHRVVNEFMIQAGIFENKACEISGEMTSNGFVNDLEHDRGVI